MFENVLEKKKFDSKNFSNKNKFSNIEKIEFIRKNFH